MMNPEELEEGQIPEDQTEDQKIDENALDSYFNHAFDRDEIYTQDPDEISFTEADAFKDYGKKFNSIDEWEKHERLRIDAENAKEERDAKRQDSSDERELRKENAKKTFVFTCLWFVFIAFVVLGQGFSFAKEEEACFSFHLSETGFITLITTSTTLGFSFYTLVIRHLFFRRDKSS